MLYQAMMLLMAATTSGAPACAFDDYSGVVAHAGTPTPQYEVAAESWFSKGEIVQFAGASYAKLGQPIQLAPFEIEFAEDLGSVPVFIEAGYYEADVIYFMVSSADCIFQRYARE
jgi:hypothetical protein